MYGRAGTHISLNPLGQRDLEGQSQLLQAQVMARRVASRSSLFLSPSRRSLPQVNDVAAETFALFAADMP